MGGQAFCHDLHTVTVDIYFLDLFSRRHSFFKEMVATTSSTAVIRPLAVILPTLPFTRTLPVLRQVEGWELNFVQTEQLLTLETRQIDSVI